MSLRRIAALSILGATVLALFIAGSLILLTTAIHRMTSRTGAAVESIRLAEEAEIDLLLHERSVTPLIRRSIESDLLGRLARGRAYVTTAEESSVLEDSAAAVEAYFDVARDPSTPSEENARRHQEAYAALERLATINVAQARESLESSSRWNDLADRIGIAVAGTVLLVAGGLFVWVRGRVFEPILELSTAMERFGSGDHDVRAAERGPIEILEMGRRFNEMAVAIARQRRAQLAFLGGVAHDLRNPISVLRASVALLGRDPNVSSDERSRSVLARIERQVSSMNRMIEDLLDASRIESGELELRLERFDLAELVEELIATFRDALPGRTIDLRRPEAAMTLLADRVRIEQVLANLIGNAAKYSPPAAPIEVALEARGDEVVLRVTDQGVGIPDAELARIFEPFRRVGRHQAEVPGAGLGLFVVRRIVAVHGGRIEVESTVGRGSTFSVFLPRRVGSDESLALDRASRIR